ncbi:LOW QUALITY PROTEIN: uncharacterized protein LOC133837822 [Drosophila sulfurigaster albostrigata]|uniref:LOW QUALITY PROTEIN: uncharacterized protein LOC133837822 n=1 Tax=Drosophila sulfurigaster albostrigata TaxID=89887 RepID=UPI002D21E06A|nr:LOW QUALITY PROTEIN: uncharacterized protein LOC133837822 [Drosophila sulfurigaster albostrigata]
MQTFTIYTLLGMTIVMTAAHATPTLGGSDNSINSDYGHRNDEQIMIKLNERCIQNDNHSCTMLKTIVFMDRLLKKSNIDLSENFRVSRNRDIPDVPDDPEDELLLARAMDSDEESYGLLIANKLWRFVRSRSLRYKFSDNADFVMSSEPKGSVNIGFSVRPIEALEEGRGKMKNMGPLMMMMAAKTGMVGALLLKGLFLLAGKALIVSKIALLLAVIISLKKLLAQKKTIVEVPSHHDSYSAGWSRALDGFVEGLAEVPAHILSQDAQDMAYNAQQPTKVQ